jgi:hypothetical protein
MLVPWSSIEPKHRFKVKMKTGGYPAGLFSISGKTIRRYKNMADESNFIVRTSGRKPGSFYIDYSGVYKLTDIAKVAAMGPSAVKEIYLDSGAVLDESIDVYYFGSIEAAQNAISALFSKIRSEQRGKMIFLTGQEIEYIRKALINEGSNAISIKSSVKDRIFEKLNS